MTATTQISPTSHPLPKPDARQAKFDQQHKLLVKQTQKWIAQTFYGQMLQQVRKSPFKDEKLSGGRGGEAFGEMLDQQLADRISRSSGSKLVNAIVDKIEYAQQQRSGNTLIKRRGSRGISPMKPIDIKA